jgi:formate dehydrogenase major subunit
MIKLNIDGKEVKGYPGQTILQVAREHGIDIPTLCYDERVKTYGACGLCVVETESSPKLLRACATEISPGMVISTNSPRVRESRKLTLELLLSDHVGDCRGPCIKACPAHTDVQGYVGLIANGQYRPAVALLKEKLPIPASIGRVCPHPCEDACRRQLVEEPLAIANLKYFVADIDLNSAEPYMPTLQPASGKSAAIIGAGPAGLTAAFFLAQAGHKVAVYDAMPQAGGMLRYGIPEYRLPKKILDKEIQLIARMGVEFIYNTKIGVDITLEYLRKNYDTVFIGIGAWEASGMRCQGEDLPGVLGGIDFLRQVALNDEISIGERVAVVGGGNTAMDAARTAVRLGAKEVMVLYRRTRAEMPAEDIEIQEAEEEGVEFRFLVAPLEVIPESGYASAIRVQKMELGEPDASGRRSPVPIPGAEAIIPVDTIISAIGQKVKAAGLEDVALSKWGSIAVEEDTLQTNLPGVFAGGDGVTGPGIAIAAVAQGRRAALAMINYLAGKELPVPEPYIVEQQNLTAEDFAAREKIARTAMPHLSADKRRRNFREVNLGLEEEKAIAEAKRCLECGCKDYFECKLIDYANQYEVRPERLEGDKRAEKLKEQHPFIERNSEKCILCGLCIRVCDEVMGVTALGLVHRGFESIVQPEFSRPLKDTSCITCGQCAALCPTGALMEHYPVVKNVPLSMQATKTVCSFCGVGCEQIISTGGGMILRALPAAGEVLCRKGRFGWAGYNQKRLTQPLVRRDGILNPASWDEAYKQAAKSAQSFRARNGNAALAVFVSPAYSMEEASAAVQYGQRALGTDKISSFTPDCGAGLQKIWGLNISTNSLEELAATDVIVAVGSFGESRIAAVKIQNAVKSGARLVTISPEAGWSRGIATLQITSENTTAFIKQIIKAIINANYTNTSYIEARVNGFAELQKALAAVTVSGEAQAAAQIYGPARKAMIVVDGYSVTAAAVELLADMALITGKIGSPRNGLTVVTPGSNQSGVYNAGVTSPPEALVDALKKGDLKGIFIFGEDPVGAGVIAAADLAGAQLKVVVTPFMTPTAACADIVLPGSIPFEADGTCLSADGTVKYYNQVVAPPAGIDNRQLISGLAAALQVELETFSAKKLPANWEQPVKFRNGFAFADGKARLAVPADDKLFALLPELDPAIRWLNEKLTAEGITK